MKAKYPKAYDGESRLPLGDIAEKVGFCKKSELPAILSAVSTEISKSGVAKGFGRDKLVINAVRAQRTLEDSLNTQAETLREWYSIHFPELDNIVKDNKEYALLVSKIGLRKNANEAELEKVLVNKKYAKVIAPVAKESFGSDVSEEDLRAIREYAETVIKSAGDDERLRLYIDKVMKEIAPNVSAVATPYVGALLMEQAGSLEKLAQLPASTVQILGAQKAIFRFLKTKKLPPKHGVLYLHPLVSQAPKKAKGKISRSLAGKISIAARVDFYRGKPVGERLKKETEERAESLKQ
jgi:nucleolar protein 56